MFTLGGRNFWEAKGIDSKKAQEGAPRKRPLITVPPVHQTASTHSSSHSVRGSPDCASRFSGHLHGLESTTTGDMCMQTAGTPAHSQNVPCKAESFSSTDDCDVDAALYVAERRFHQPCHLGQYERPSAIFTVWITIFFYSRNLGIQVHNPRFSLVTFPRIIGIAIWIPLPSSAL